MENMILVSVNVGKEQKIQNAKASGKTGIYKTPVEGSILMTRNGFVEDYIADKKHHGGVDQAVYVYGEADYQWWAGELSRPLAPGTFGENLTISGLESAQFFVGDRLKIGDAVLEITAPRIPCVTLAARMGDPMFVKRFRHAERPGLYCRVTQEGRVQAGMPVSVERYSGETVSILEMFQEFYEPRLDEATLRRYLAAPIAIRDRVEKEEKLKAVQNKTVDG